MCVLDVFLYLIVTQAQINSVSSNSDITQKSQMGDISKSSGQHTLARQKNIQKKNNVHEKSPFPPKNLLGGSRVRKRTSPTVTYTVYSDSPTSSPISFHQLIRTHQSNVVIVWDSVSDDFILRFGFYLLQEVAFSLPIPKLRLNSRLILQTSEAAARI